MVGCLASVTVFCSGRVLYGWDVGDVVSYEWSHALGNLFGSWSLLAGVGILLLLVPFSAASYWISVCIVPVPMLVAILYECFKYPKSHNLVPFELIMLAVGSALLHLPSFTIKVINERPFRQSNKAIQPAGPTSRL